VPAISTGEMLREAVAEGSELGARVAEILASGALVDDDTMAAVVRERLSWPDAGRGFLLDGYPRTLRQAADLDAILRERGMSLDAVVDIAVPVAELLRRAMARGRADDREEVIRRRLALHGETSAPLIGYYRDRSLLREVAGDRPIGEVTQAISAALAVGV
jgi:adenylate kinase